MTTDRRELTQADALPEESPEEFAAKICDLFEGKPIPSYIMRNGQAKTEFGTVTAFAPEVKRAMATNMIVRALKQAAAPPATGEGWISVKEWLPEMGQRVLVVIDGIVQHTMAYLSDGEWHWTSWEADTAPMDAVSHWWLPDPPKKGKP